MLSLPQYGPTDPIELADWVEISALRSLDGNASAGDLRRCLGTAGLFEAEDDEDEAIEQKSLDVFVELEERAQAAAEAYPFDVRSGLLQMRSKWENCTPYTFCLCLSWFGTRSQRPRKLFEELACLAAKSYVQGDGIVFGAPRQDFPTEFREAVSRLCQRIGEGNCYDMEKPSLSRQDDKLDVVAWKDFADRRPSKLLLFGQCASGRDWEDKVAELEPSRFCRKWIRSGLVSPGPIRSFFIPRRIDPRKWDFVGIDAGILFDRCRTAYWAQKGCAGSAAKPYISWTKGVLSSVSS